MHKVILSASLRIRIWLDALLNINNSRRFVPFEGRFTKSLFYGRPSFAELRFLHYHKHI